LNKEIESAKLRASFNNTDEQAQIKLNELIGKRDQLEADRVGRQKEINQQLIGIQKQIDMETLNQQKQLQKERDDAFKQAMANRVQEFENSQQAEIIALKNRYVNGEIEAEAYNNRLAEIERANLELRQTIFKEFGQQLLNETTLSAELRAQIQADLEKNLIDSEEKILDAKIKASQQATEASKKEAAIKKQSEQAKLSAVGDSIGNIGALYEQNSEQYKNIAALQTLISTYEGAQNTYTALAKINPILAAVSAGAAVVAGLARVAQIRSTPAFADGVIGLEGAGTETSDSIDARLSKGESVITAKTTSMFAPILAQMEKIAGNNPNWGRSGNKKFATGVIGLGSMASSFIQPPQRGLDASDLSQIQPIVKVTDINRVQGEVARTVRVADVG
jgi:hypothetical protein